MLKIHEEDYAYAASRIRALEAKLLDGSKINRMLDAPTAQEALKVISEAEYGYSGSNLESVSSFEVLLSEEMEKCYSLLTELSPQPEVINVFKRRYDYFNIKVLIKAEFLGQEAPSILVGTGIIDGESLKRMIRERDYRDLEPIMVEAIKDTYDTFSKTHDPQTVDLIMDKASYAQFAADMKNIDSQFLKDLAEMMIDITNIKMFFRTKVLGKAWNFINKLILDGGSISGKEFFENSDKSLDSFVENVRFSRYGDAVRKSWELYKAKGDPAGLERLLDDYQMAYVRNAKKVVMGVEPLIAYLFAKEAEIRNVRIIMTGKINNLPVDLIRERLRQVYV
jgi:V/A-type H+-transporting ATPase subunit C